MFKIIWLLNYKTYDHKYEKKCTYIEIFNGFMRKIVWPPF